jgi:hypothetical protein
MYLAFLPPSYQWSQVGLAREVKRFRILHMIIMSRSRLAAVLSFTRWKAPNPVCDLNQSCGKAAFPCRGRAYLVSQTYVCCGARRIC